MKRNKAAARAVQVTVVSLIVLSFTACSRPEVQIWIDGPWAIVEGPAGTPYAGRLLLIAPAATPSLHAAPAVPLTNSFYDLKNNSKLEINNVLPPKNQTEPSGANFPPSVSITSKELGELLASSIDRYVVSLPMPESYHSAMIEHSKVGTNWWPGCHAPSCFKESEFTTQLVLHYRVSRLDGFILDSAKQSFQDNQPMIRISMVPWSYMASKGLPDPCDMGGRRAFNNLVGMFPSLDQHLFVDLMVKESDGSMGPYPSDKDDHSCLLLDAQNPFWHHPIHFPWPLPDATLDGVKQAILHTQPPPDELEKAWESIQVVLSEKYKAEYGERSPEYEERQGWLANVTAALHGKDAAQGLKDWEVINSDLRQWHSHPENNGSGACRNPILMLHAN